MGEEKKMMGYYWSPLMKLVICLMVPLILVSGFVSIRGSRSSFWGLSSSNTIYNPLSSSSTQNHSTKSQVSTKDLRSKIDRVIGNLAEQATETEHSVLSSPPLAVQPVSPLLPPTENVATLLKEVYPNSTHIVITTSNETQIPSPTRTAELEVVKATDLDRLEARLQLARATIKDSQYGNHHHDPEFDPIGPMYWNANAFSRSYVEMENHFKVYVYEEGEPPLFHNGPCKSIYSTEGNFIHQMEINNHFRTKNPDKAHAFFLPFSIAMMVQFVYVRDSRDFGPIRHTVIDYINIISTKYPYWNRSLGADHFMLSCHDWGPEASFSVPYLGKNSIRVLCNANTSEGFRPEKDVSFPEINLQTGAIKGFVGGPSPSRRSILAFFAGGVHGPIRPILLEHWENKDVDMKIYKYLPKGVSYYNMLRNSKFCICPSGYEVASPRVVEAIYTGCVPVLMSDHYVPPFSDVLNWKSFSVSVSVKDIPNLKAILTGISTSQYLRMYRRILKIRRHFEVHSPPKRYDFFHMILHSVWLRRLNVRVGGHQEL